MHRNVRTLAGDLVFQESREDLKAALPFGRLNPILLIIHAPD
jgi:hypothetical protein